MTWPPTPSSSRGPRAACRWGGQAGGQLSACWAVEGQGSVRCRARSSYPMDQVDGQQTLPWLACSRCKPATMPFACGFEAHLGTNGAVPRRSGGASVRCSPDKPPLRCPCNAPARPLHCLQTTPAPPVIAPVPAGRDVPPHEEGHQEPLGGARPRHKRLLDAVPCGHLPHRGGLGSSSLPAGRSLPHAPCQQRSALEAGARSRSRRLPSLPRGAVPAS